MHQRKNPVNGPANAVRREPMADQRYQQLMARLGALFSQTEEGTAADQRLAVIAEITEQMAKYGLSAEDLAD